MTETVTAGVAQAPALVPAHTAAPVVAAEAIYTPAPQPVFVPEQQTVFAQAPQPVFGPAPQPVFAPAPHPRRSLSIWHPLLRHLFLASPSKSLSQQSQALITARSERMIS